MPAYLVQRSAEVSGVTTIGGVNAMVVFAPDATTAKELADKHRGGDSRWNQSDVTVTEIAAPTWDGWTFRVQVTSLDPPVDVEVTGDDDALDTVAEIAAALVTALNATAAIAGASWSAPTLTIASGAGGDDLGDQTVEVTVTPPTGTGAIANLVGTVTHEGAATDPLSVVLPTDAAVPLVAAEVQVR